VVGGGSRSRSVNGDVRVTPLMCSLGHVVAGADANGCLQPTVRLTDQNTVNS